MKKINICENHDEALKVWRRQGIKNAIVIHVDAHIDFTATDECFYITIANYLNYAYDEEIIKSMIWIIPDLSYDNRNVMTDIIQEISCYFNLKQKSIHNLIFELIGNEDFILYITTIQHINMLNIIENEKIIIDIDCDYFMNPMINYTYSYFFLEKCWMTREIFCEKMQYIYERCSVTTISNSIIGGYTPLLFSFISLQIEGLFQKKINVCNQEEEAIDTLLVSPYGALNLFLRNSQSTDKQKEVHWLLGVTYCYMLLENYKEAEKSYIKLFEKYRNYERYFLPVYGLIKEGLYGKAEELLEKWLKVVPYSKVAICYKIRVLLEKKHINPEQVESLFDMLTDAETCYEKSYLYTIFYLKTQKYTQVISFGFCIINYLLENNSPEWIGQISSFEKYKNHGIIIAEVYNFISIAYMKLGNRNAAMKYARISKLMGYSVDLAE